MQSNHFAHKLPFGAELQSDGNTVFRIWAPSVETIEIEIKSAGTHQMVPGEGGWFEQRIPCGAGTRYRYRMADGLTIPDPASRRQDGDVHGWSVVLDPHAYEWQNVGWNGRSWREAIVYELHAGAMGGFSGVTGQLERLADLGFTTIEIMPIADFPGQHNWGYDGVLPFAPDEAYGTPGELKTLIDRAHGLGLSVMLDVVYNHFGPDGAYLHAYAKQFFDEGKHTPWGAAIDFTRPEVCSYFIQNALYWLNEYRFDGLRFDAVHAIAEPGFLPKMASAIRSGIEPGREIALVLEHEGNKSSLLDGPFDAQWADDAHHCLHVLLTGETEGYYENFVNAAEQLARCLREGFAYQGEKSPQTGKPRGEPSGHLPTTAFVYCLQNHDQIGNRAMGERLIQLADPDALAAATAMLMLAPMIPLVFMGEEFGSRAPFLFFTDHNAELAKLVREGRRKEFAYFAAFADPHRREQIPDPNAPETFALSVPNVEDGDPNVTALYRVLLDTRTRHIVPRLNNCRSAGATALGKTGVLARWNMGDGATLILATNFGSKALSIDPVDGPMLFESRKGDAEIVREGKLPPHTTVAFMLERT